MATGTGRDWADKLTSLTRLQLGLNAPDLYENLGLLGGAGTSANPETTATASKNYLNFYTKSTASSGTSRGIYWLHYLSGTGDGECVRARSILGGSVSGGSVHGAHLTLQLATGAATATGQGAAVRATLDRGSVATVQGTLTSLLVESVSAANSQTATEWSLMKFVTTKNGGGGAGTEPALFAALTTAATTTGDLNAGSLASSAAMVITGATAATLNAATTAGLHVVVNDTHYVIPLATAT